MKVAKKFGAFLIFLIASVFFLFLPKKVLALKINEFSSDTLGTTADPDWVELFNDNASSVALSGYHLSDDYGNVKDLTGSLDPNAFVTIDWSNRLDKDGDVVKLIENSSSNEIDKVGYGTKGTDIIAPSSGQSAGRLPDGSGNWFLLTSPTKGFTNNTASPVPTSTPTSTPIPTSTPTPKPSPTSIPVSTNTPTPTSIPTFIPTPTKKTTPTLTPTSTIEPSPSEEILLVTDNLPTPTINNEQGQVLGVANENKDNSLLPKVLIGLGLFFIVGSLAMLLLPKITRYKLNKIEN